ncbi:MAG: SET domain-containing protein-lysine N-methyltransferase [Verrucomicrobia bacterium]|nr:SET domain-containing protein-lysine N-methyltransferase [Verrucomicrobiota bacterium]
MASRKPLDDERETHRKLLKFWKRGQSEYCEVRDSGIHGRGVYATCFIPKETPIIEYFGERIDKKESERRGVRQQEKANQTGDAAVYIFTLSKNFDIDGDFPWNTARLINHSCNPNCEAWIVGRKIMIHALRDIQSGEELTFDYGFDVDCYEDHPCRCGAPNCIGYIVSREQWSDLEKRLEARNKSR